jgi:hypothetical protein
VSPYAKNPIPKADFQPIKRLIIENLKWLVKDAKMGDHLVFVFSGHGGQGTKGVKCSLVNLLRSPLYFLVSSDSFFLAPFQSKTKMEMKRMVMTRPYVL